MSLTLVIFKFWMEVFYKFFHGFLVRQNFCQLPPASRSRVQQAVVSALLSILVLVLILKDLIWDRWLSHFYVLFTLYIYFLFYITFIIYLPRMSMIWNRNEVIKSYNVIMNGSWNLNHINYVIINWNILFPIFTVCLTES